MVSPLFKRSRSQEKAVNPLDSFKRIAEERFKIVSSVSESRSWTLDYLSIIQLETIQFYSKNYKIKGLLLF
jgi:hypothetical protein